MVGHVEWVDFARVGALPARGHILDAEDHWQDAGGGGAVAAVELVRLGAEPVHFFCALGDDEAAARTRARLQELGVRVHAAVRPRPQRRAVTLLDDAGERTILVLGEPLVPHGDDRLPWGELGAVAGVYLASGDPDAVRRARAARVLVAAARAGDALGPARVRLDALVGSASDPADALLGARLDPPPAVTLRTAGAEGGTWERADGVRGAWPAGPPPRPVRDAYGCGDCFAAGLALGLGAGDVLEAAVARAAAAGAAALTRRGASG